MAKDLKVNLIFDTSKFEQGIKNVNNSLKRIDSSLNLSNANFTRLGKTTDLLKTKAVALSSKIEVQKQKVDMLSKAYQESVKEKGKDADSTVKLENRLTSAIKELNKTEESLRKVRSELANQPNAFDKMGNAVDRLNNKFEVIGQKISSFGNKLTVGLSLPLVAVAKKTVDSLIEFESAFAGVEKTVDGTKEQMDSLRQGIRDMAKEIPSSREEIAKVAEIAGQLGIETDSILDFTRTIIDLGNSTNIVGEEGAASLARFANITKMSQKDFNKLGSVIVDLGNNFATTEKEILNMSTRLAGAGSQLGLREPQILAIATAMSSVGIEAEAGGSAFSKLMVRMQLAVETGNEDLKLFAKVAGMSAGEFKTAFQKDAMDGIESFIKGVGNVEQNGKSAIAVLDDMNIKEVRLRDTVLRLSGNSELLSKSIEMGNIAWKENTALTEEASKRYATIKSKIQILKNTISDIGLTIANSFSPQIKDMLDKVISLGKSFTDLKADQVQKIVKTFAGLVALGPGIKIFGSSMTAISKTQNKLTETLGGIGNIAGKSIDKMKMFGVRTKDVFNNLSNSFSGFGKVFDFLPGKLGGILNVIKTKASSFGGIISKGFAGVPESVKNVFSKMGEIAEAGVNKMSSITKLALKLIGPLAIVGLLLTGLGLLQQNFGEEIEKMVTFATTKLPEIIQSFATKIVENIPILIDAGIQLLNSLVEIIIINLPIIIDAGVQLLMALIDGVVNNIDKLIEMTINLVLMLITVIVDNLPKIIEGGLKLLIALVEGIVNNIDKLIDGILELIIKVIEVIIENLPKIIEAGIKILVALIEGLVKALPKLIEYIPEIIEAVFKAFGEIDWGELGKNIIDGLIAGLKATKDLVVDTLKSIARGAIDGFKKMFGIQSPSKVFAKFGVNMNEGLAEGLEDSGDMFENSLNKLRNIADTSLNANYELAYQGVGTGSIASNNIRNTNNRVINLNISNFQNNRKQDVKELVDEISFYLNRKDLAGGR